ncbi:MAG: hypothetical protein GY839_11615 [candidate division Zixibacteria bacterium]|nr:hypothetical protein [candidate division Zixibacteria bacterium]
MDIESKVGWRRAHHDPIYFAREYLDFQPHPGQVAWLNGSTGFENALITGNRWGKSEIQALKLIHRCIFQLRPIRYDRPRHYRAMNVSITLDQAQIVFSKILALLERNKKLNALVKKIRSTPYATIIFRNGSELSARTSANRGEYLLGHDYDYVNFDEVAYEPKPEAVVEGVIKMRLADRAGTLDYGSTPNGYNWFYHRQKLIQKDKRGFVYHGSSYENPFLPKESLDYLKQSMTPARAAQHIMGKFSSFEGRLIPEEFLRKAIDMGKGPRGPQEGKKYVHGWDLARKLTFTVGIVMDISEKPFQVVHIERYQRQWPEIIARIKSLYRIYGGDVLIDSTGIGDVVLSDLEDIGAEGFNFAGGNREKLLGNLERSFFSDETALYEQTVEQPDGSTWSLVDELRALDAAYINAGDGVCALALALWAAGTPSKIVIPAMAAVGGFR